METCNFHDHDDDDDDGDDDEPSISFFIWLGFSRWIEYLLMCCLTQI